MIIRPAVTTDISGIMKVEKDAFIPSIQETEPLFAERIRVCQNCFLVFETDDTHQITGYLSAERWNSVPERDEPFIPGHSADQLHSEQGLVLYVSSFALLSSCRGRGLGKTLFNRSVEQFRALLPGITTLLLCVNTVWTGARHIYKSAGFTDLRKLPRFFPAESGQPATDGIVMIRGAVS